MAPEDLLPSAHRQTSAEHVELDLPDVVLVNPGGRVVEVTGELAEKLMLENGYRRATENEAKSIEDYKKRTNPEILKRQELRRVRAERTLADQIEKELAAEEDAANASDSNEDQGQGHDEGTTDKPKSRGSK
jgi:hypothetical protein